ncbi:O-antigen polymerase [Draconibacterium orientale]|uniref:O-antigen polymerase n=1 Tax=Draconibacterium orientale TaxID=1168034 RepID=UPI0029C089D7|nr:O-antigen polymerase [Draconibacterium orientale]
MNEEGLLVILNALLYSFTLIYLFYKKKEIDPSIFILALWSMSGILGVIYFFSEILRDSPNNITLIPFLYLFILFVITNLFFLKNDFKKIKYIHNKSKLILPIIYIIAIISFLPFVENAIYLIKSMGSDLSTFSEGYLGERNDFADTSGHLSYIGYHLNIISVYLRYISPVLLFYYLTKTKIKKIVVLGLVFSSLNPALFTLTYGTRLFAIEDMVFFIFLLLLFKGLINKRILKWIKIFSILAISLTFIGFVMVTISRFEGRSLFLFDWVARYGGEGFINFNRDMWHIDSFTYGENSFGSLKYFLGLNSTPRDAFDLQDITKISMIVFYTYIGNLFSDFGAFFTFVILAVYSFLIRQTLVVRESISLNKIIIICLIAKLSLTGFTFLPFINVKSIIIAIFFLISNSILNAFATVRRT